MIICVGSNLGRGQHVFAVDGSVTSQLAGTLGVVFQGLDRGLPHR